MAPQGLEPSPFRQDARLTAPPCRDSYTHLDFLNLSLPHEPALPYVYAHFRWDHCASAGFDIAAINASDAGSPDAIMNSVLPKDGSTDGETPPGEDDATAEGDEPVDGKRDGDTPIRARRAHL